MVCSFTLIFYCRLLFYWFSLLLGSSVNDLKFPEPAEHSLSNSTHNLFDSGAFRGGWNHRLVIHSFCLQGVQYQAYACGVNRTVHLFDKAAGQTKRSSDLCIHPKHFVCQGADVIDQRSAAGDDDSGTQGVTVSASFDLHNLFHSGLDDFSKNAFCDLLGRPACNAGDGDRLIMLNQIYEALPVVMFQFLSLIVQHAQANFYIIGHLLSRNGNDGGVADGILLKDSQICCASAYVDQYHTCFLLLVIQNGVGRSQRFQDDIGHCIPGAFHTAVKVFSCRHQSGNDVNFSFHPHTAHPHRITDTILTVHNELLGDDVNNLLIRRKHNLLTILKNPFNILHGYLFLLIIDSDNPFASDTPDMVPCNTDIDSTHLNSGCQFSLIDSCSDGIDGFVDIDYNAPVKPLTWRLSHTQDMNPILRIDRGYHRADLCRADIQSDYDLFVLTYMFHMLSRLIDC